MGQQSKNSSDEKKLIALGRVLQTLREEDNVDVLLDSTLAYLQAELEYSLIWIGFYDRLDHRILGKGGITPTGDNSFLKNKFFLQPGDLLEQVVIQQRPVGVANLAEEVRAGEWRKAAANYNIKGTLLFPIRYRDRCFGVVLLGSPQWGISPRSEEKARLSILLGGLAAALNQIEVDWNRTRIKRPDQPMFRMLDRLPPLRMLQRLEAIVAETHQFIAPTRTSIFWFERERRYFWRRMSNRQAAIEATPAASGITVQESGGFYNALVADQTISIGESRSSLKGDITSRLLQRLGARSLIAAPIRLGDELLGFLGCEASEPRIWKEEEKSYIRAAAQLVALISPMEEMEAIVEQTKQDQTITAQIATAITSEEDWQQTIKTCAEQLSKRLQVDRFLILLLDPEEQQFEICYQSHPVNRRPIGRANTNKSAAPGLVNPQFLPSLSQVDWQMLERSKEAIPIEDLSSDLKLLLWRESFLEAGVRSLLICNTSIGRPLTGMLIATSENPRTWTSAEREIFRLVSQQVGLILNQWQLQRRVAVQEKNYQSLQWALTAINAVSAPSSSTLKLGEESEPEILKAMEEVALQSVVTILGAEVAVLVSWLPGSDRGEILATPVTNYQFAINSEPIASVKNDPLIQEALATDSLIIKNISELAATTRSWICGTGISQVLAIALRTAPEHATLGVIVAGMSQPRILSNNLLSMFGVLTSQLASSRRLTYLAYTLASQRQELQCLNWYKHRLVEDFYLKTWSSGHRASSTEKSSLPKVISSISYMLSNEYWKMSKETSLKENPQRGDSIKLTTLLLRSMERIDSCVKNRHIWTQIHDAGGNEKVPFVTLENSPKLVKIELVLYEILLAACDRCPNGGRIDIWYRVLSETEKQTEKENKTPPSTLQLELSITDNGRIDPQLIADLQNILSDELAPSSLDSPPGLHLRICQLLIEQMGGTLNFYQIDDGRILSRLLIPI